MKKILIFSVLVILLSTGCKEELTISDPLEVVETYFEYRNAHDIEKTLSLFSDSIVFVMDENTREMGKEHIRKLESWNAAIYGQLSIPKMKIKGDTVLMTKITEVNQWYKSLGIDSVVYKGGTYAIVHNGLITEMRPSPLSNNSAIEASAKLRQFMAWAANERTVEMFNLMPKGQFDYSPQNASKWLELMREWSAISDTSTSY